MAQFVCLVHNLRNDVNMFVKHNSQLNATRDWAEGGVVYSLNFWGKSHRLFKRKVLMNVHGPIKEYNE